jgi:hypothetical protein
MNSTKTFSRKHLTNRSQYLWPTPSEGKEIKMSSIQQRGQSTGRCRGLSIATCLMLTVGAPAASAEDLTVTGVSGLPRANGVSLLMHDRLSERVEPIELETNRRSGVSVLYGESISLQLGPSTKLFINPATAERGELIEVVRGELRTVTRRDRSKKRPEIHTPTAVIRPSTSVLHVLVDDMSGDTEVTSIESRAWVVSSNPALKQSSILNSGQQVTIRASQAPGSIRKYHFDAASDVTGFMSGRKLREDALVYDMTRDGKLALSQIALNDVPEKSLPSVVSPFPNPVGLGWQATSATRDYNICGNTTLCNRFDGVPRPAQAFEKKCGLIFGEHCVN